MCKNKKPDNSPKLNANFFSLLFYSWFVSNFLTAQWEKQWLPAVEKYKERRRHQLSIWQTGKHCLKPKRSMNDECAVPMPSIVCSLLKLYKYELLAVGVVKLFSDILLFANPLLLDLLLDSVSDPNVHLWQGIFYFLRRLADHTNEFARRAGKIAQRNSQRNQSNQTVRLGIIRSLVDMLNFTSPFLVAIGAFTTFILLDPAGGRSLTPKSVFVSLTLFNQIRSPMTMIGMLINLVVQTTVSKRPNSRVFVGGRIGKERNRRKENTSECHRSADSSNKCRFLLRQQRKEWNAEGGPSAACILKPEI
ncbi:hypothetical protein niasHS_002867 [Heterodera schachtii]|uniref:ABC transmembrane type-1 domain-containing protein n=1 Tax=Heterodera schachtii TaxID=97005 RepID=A0ABD2K2P0_HETSC